MSSSRSPTPTVLVAAKKLEKVPDYIGKELQRYLAVAAYERNKDKSMHEKEQCRAIENSFHGNGGDAVGQVWKFLNLKESYFKTLVHREDVHNTGVSSSILPIVISKTFSRSDCTLILGDSGNITSDILKRTFMNKPQRNSGRHIMDMAKEEAREAKKMVSQMSEAVKMGIVERNGGEYTYCSGKTEEDLDNFICFRMFNWDRLYGASGGDDAVEEADLDNLNVAATDEEMSKMPCPPKEYLPKGFFLFKGRGPMAPKKDRYDLVNNGLSHENGSRTKTRQEEKKKKDGACNFEAGTDGGRGMSLGATYKDMAIISQQKRKLDQLDHAADIACITSVLNSKNSRWKTTLDTIKMLHEIGQAEEAKKMAQELPEISAEVKKLESQLELLKNQTVDTNAPVEIFLQRGSQAMGLKTPTTPKKAKVTDLTNDDDKSESDDNN